MRLYEIKNLELQYTKTAIESVAQFQNYGGSVPGVGKSLFSNSWPANITSASDVLYRSMVLPASVVDLILSGKSYSMNRVSSWSKAKDIAKNFIHEQWFVSFYDDLYDDGKNPTILLLQKKISNKVVDIDALHKDANFQKCIEYYESNGYPFNEGLDYGDSQKEVAVSSFVLHPQDIVEIIPFDQPSWISVNQVR